MLNHLLHNFLFLLDIGKQEVAVLQKSLEAKAVPRTENTTCNLSNLFAYFSPRLTQFFNKTLNQEMSKYIQFKSTFGKKSNQVIIGQNC